MGVNERKEKEKEVRRNDIIDASEKVIFSKGYDLATIEDIAREAEFSKRTIYVYFNSKEQLYFEIMVRGYRKLIQMMEAPVDEVSGVNALDQLKQFARTLYQFSKEYPDYFKAIMEYENGERDFVNGVPDQSKEECYLLGEKMFAYLTSALKNGIEQGVIRSDLDVVNSAIVLWSCTLGLFNTLIKKRNYIQHYHKRDSEELLLEGIDTLVRSIQSESRGKQYEK
ncbi:TetR/AcrR family transcriptional regulator [Paenibacillus puldeungensis]|uniref:TetR/AcrR family transcriptional regulator n=1 Tax=Paenibacillus puldeungensis TaxID=696536 RepID=A0ABW3RVU7_9BACL